MIAQKKQYNIWRDSEICLDGDGWRERERGWWSEERGEYSKGSKRHHSLKYTLQSTQRNTSLFWDVKLRWTTRTLALWDALHVRLSACENVCATEDGIIKNWIPVWNLTNTKSKGLIPASLDAAPLSELGFLSSTLKHTHQGHQVISTISRVVSDSWFKIKKWLKGMKDPPGEARVA